MTDEQIKALRKASEILCGNAYHGEAAIINALLADSGKGEAVAWTKVEALEAMTENEGSWIWKYDPLRPVESDDVFLYLAAPRTDVEKRK